MSLSNRGDRFWKRQTNKVITYEVSGKTHNNLYNVVETTKRSSKISEGKKSKNNFLQEAPEFVRNDNGVKIPKFRFTPPLPPSTPRTKEKMRRSIFNNEVISSKTTRNYESPLKKEIADKMVNILNSLGNNGKVDG